MTHDGRGIPCAGVSLCHWGRGGGVFGRVPEQVASCSVKDKMICIMRVCGGARDMRQNTARHVVEPSTTADGGRHLRQVCPVGEFCLVLKPAGGDLKAGAEAAPAVTDGCRCADRRSGETRRLRKRGGQ